MSKGKNSYVLPLLLIIVGGAMIYAGMYGTTPVALFKDISQGKVPNNGK